MNRKTIGAISLGATLLLSTQVFSQEQDTAEYRDGYNLVLDQQWADAREYFENFREEWPESVWADDATFWSCYANEQEQSEEGADKFSCYQQFIDNFPDSSWVEDARSKLAVLGSELAARGNPGFLSQVGDDWDWDWDFDIDIDGDEIAESVERAMRQAERELERIGADVDLLEFPRMPNMPDLPDFPNITEEQIEEFRAIARDAQRRARAFSRRRNSADDELLTLIGALRDDERVSDLLIQRLESTDNPELRSRLVLLLQDLPGEGITATLLDVADNDESEDVRNSAILVLLDRDEEESRGRLLEIIDDENYPVSVRAEIIGELDNWDSDQAIGALSDIVNNETNPVLVEEAADALSDIETVETMDILVRSFAQRESPEIKRVILEEIADIEFDTVIQFLTDVAVSEDVDDETAATAIDGIADRENNFAVAALDTIYASTSNTQRKLAALDGLGDTEARQAAEVLTLIVEQEQDIQLLAAAVRALGETEHVLAVDPVVQAYRNSEDETVRRSAVRALRDLEQYPVAIDAMLEILEDRLAREAASDSQ